MVSLIFIRSLKLLKTLLCFSFILSFFYSQDGVAAIVGDEIILESAVQEQVSAFLLNVDNSVSPDSVRVRVLDYLIEQEVLAYFANKDSLLQVEDSQIKSVVGERLDFFKKQLGSISALEEYFGVEYLEIEGLLKKEAKKMLLSDLFKSKLFSYVSVSSKEVEDFYYSYKDSLPLTPFLYSYSCFEIGVSSNKEVLNRTENVAKAVLNQIIKGDSFESFYSVYSGGDLGLFRRGTFIQEFEELAFSLKEGEVGGPVLSSLGFHLIRLNRRVGEKIDASHILFPVKITDEDIGALKSSLEEIKRDFSLNLVDFDSLSLSSAQSFGGVFNKAPENTVPKIILGSLKNQGPGVLSDVLELEKNVFGLVLLRSVEPPSIPNLYDYWGFVENMALEKKFFSFYSDWYSNNKKNVYINILKN